MMMSELQCADLDGSERLQYHRVLARGDDSWHDMVQSTSIWPTWANDGEIEVGRLALLWHSRDQASYEDLFNAIQDS